MKQDRLNRVDESPQTLQHSTRFISFRVQVPHFHHLKRLFAPLLAILLSLGAGGLAMAQQTASASRDGQEPSRSAAARPAPGASGKAAPRSAAANQSTGKTSAANRSARPASASTRAVRRTGAAPQAVRKAGTAPQAGRKAGTAPQAGRKAAAAPPSARQRLSRPQRQAAPNAAQPPARAVPARPTVRPQAPAAALAATTGALSTAGLAQPDRAPVAPQTRLPLHSSVALVVDQQSGEILLDKNPREVLPIASITKLMTAMVVLDARQRLDERLQITREDIDTLRHSGSRLRPGVKLTRGEMLQLALMASENRAANALGRHYPGGMPAFVSAMNAKARMIGMHQSRFVEPTGLSSRNVSNGQDLARLVREAWNYPLIRQYSVARSMSVRAGQQSLGYFNTNRLVSTQGWTVGLQKTGYISDAGNCLVMQARIDGRPLIFVLLDANGAMARFGDAQRIRSWLQNPSAARYTQTQPPRYAFASAGS